LTLDRFPAGADPLQMAPALSAKPIKTHNRVVEAQSVKLKAQSEE